MLHTVSVFDANRSSPPQTGCSYQRSSTKLTLTNVSLYLEDFCPNQLSFVPEPGVLKLSANFMMWGPTQNGPMTQFVPRVIAKEKIVLMWEHWNQSGSPKCASPTSYPHPGRPKLPSSPDGSKWHQCWTWANKQSGEGRRGGQWVSEENCKVAVTWLKQIMTTEASRFTTEPL